MTPGPTPVAPANDVIHDIGYRSYDGDRLGRSYAARSLLVDSLRGAYGLGRSAKSKVVPMLLMATMVIPALVIVMVVLATRADELPLDYTNYAVYLSAALAIFVAATAPQMVSKDLRFGVLPLYLARPITRSDYVRAKFVAMTAAIFILLAAPLLVMYAGALLAKLDFSDQTLGLLGGLLGALVFAVLLAGLGLAIASVTGRRGIGIAAIIAVVHAELWLRRHAAGAGRVGGGDQRGGLVRAALTHHPRRRRPELVDRQRGRRNRRPTRNSRRPGLHRSADRLGGAVVLVLDPALPEGLRR